MARFIKGRVRLQRLDGWLRADARRWVGPASWCWTAGGMPVDGALATLDAAFAATFGGA